jgi:hypothetical protein
MAGRKPGSNEMRKLIQIVPTEDFRLFGAMVKKEVDLCKRSQGTFYRSGPKKKNEAKWSHKTYKGWINLQRASGEIVIAEILSKSPADVQWQLFHAFLGWVDRHFGDKVTAINIQHRE